MKTANVKFLLFICLLFSKGSLMGERTDYTKEEYALMSRCVNEIESVLIKDVGKQLGLQCSGRGGSMPYDIQNRQVSFHLCQQVTIEKARELLIKATERFIELVNAHEVVRPYLRDYPWDHYRARIMISFSQKNGKDYPEGIRLIFTAKGNIFYYGPEKFPNDIDHMKEEPYTEAKNIVNGTPSCLKPVQQKKKWFGWF